MAASRIGSSWLVRSARSRPAIGVRWSYRLQLKIGNRELTGADFVWIDEGEIAETVDTERSRAGRALGVRRRLRADRRRHRGRRRRGGCGARRPRSTGFSRAGETWRRERSRLEKERETSPPPADRSSRNGSICSNDRRGRDAGRSGGDRRSRRPRSMRRRPTGSRHVSTRSNTTLDDFAGGLLSAPTGPASRGRTTSRCRWPTSSRSAGRIRWAGFRRSLRAVREGVLFLFTEPREANTEGGIFPALFGTVLLVLLMSVAVVPLGVVTAVYMTEYARPGILLRLANQAVNNLAGVPVHRLRDVRSRVLHLRGRRHHRHARSLPTGCRHRPSVPAACCGRR